tara:strand:+ start:165 stop:734 length:570 start_codon:yes stop_codon:yes gene_type:complete
MVRKYPEELDNQIDNLIYDNLDKPTKLFHNLGFTPNGITTLSLISSMLSIYFFQKKEYTCSAITYGLNYYFDCMDGFMARKYKQYSKFGDIYDHLTDIISNGIYLYMIFGSSISNYIKIANIIFLFTFIYYYSCLEKYTNSTSITSVSSCLCTLKSKSEIENRLKTLRIFGCGTYNIICVITIYVLNFF